MRVLVTGGTGFVGSHTVAKLLRNNHELHLLIRSPRRMAAAFGSLDIGELPYTVGDVTDPKSVEKAMEGCEALVHAASIYSLDNRVASQMRDVNATGTSVVLGTASSLGLDPIVYPESTEGRPWGQPLKKLEGAPLNLG